MFKKHKVEDRSDMFPIVCDPKRVVVIFNFMSFKHFYTT